MKERLVELIDKAKKEYVNDVTDHTETEYIVEGLLNEGVIVPPCKVGDTVFVIYPGYEKEIERGIADEIIIDEYRNVRVLIVEPETNDGRVYRYRKPSEWGEFVFSTKEEAEQKLVNYESSKYDEKGK